MPLETRPRNVVYARTILTLEEQLAALPQKNGGGHKPAIVIVCNGKCNQQTRDSDKRILICGEFRCSDCFAKLVHSQKAAFGLSKTGNEAPTEAEIESILVPFDQPFVPNLYEPKETPRFVCILNPLTT